MEALRKMGADVAEKKIHSLPRDLTYLLDHFNACRRQHPLTYQEIKAFSDVMKCGLKPWEVNVIINIDSILEASRG